MSAIVPLDATGGLPAYLKNRAPGMAQINADVLSSGPSFAVLSTKGKHFTMVKGGEKKLLTRVVDGEEEPRPFVQLTVVRANVKARQYYKDSYDEEGSEGKRPDCLSFDGITPSASAAEPQAKKCAACPHSVWGSKTAKPGDEEAGGKGTACSVNTRLAVIDPEDAAEKPTPFLLRVPAGSKKNYAEVVKMADNRSIPYNALVLRVGFDPEAQHRLTFKPTGVLSDQLYATVSSMYDSDEVKEILGLIEPAAPKLEAPAVDTAELDAALAAKAVSAKAKATAAEVAAAVEKPAPKTEPKPTEPKKEAKPKAAVADDASSLLSQLDALLGKKDD